MIADTSVWIEFFRASNSPEDIYLQRALKAADPVLMPEVIYREVLQGARSAQHFIELQHVLDDITPYISPDPMALARSASLLYARCRWQGVTIRSPNDCLIAACAIESGEPLLHADRDFLTLAQIDNRLQLL